MKNTNKATDHLEQVMKCSVAQYKRAARALLNDGYYCRGRKFGRPDDGGRPGYVDIYVLDPDGEVDVLCYNTSPHRARRLLKAYQDGTLSAVPSEVINNYKTNGYITRRGLFADYSASLDRIRKIARSHADLLGCESGNSTTDHYARVAMRQS